MSHGHRLSQRIAGSTITPFMGIYDVFSASLAGSAFDGLFLSGFGLAASHYGLPDIGYIAWPDMVDLCQRIRTILPDHHLIVDIDDGYCDVEVACHVVRLLENAGASGVIIEDQQRPRRCGHFEGKQIMPLEDYVAKLKRVLSVRDDLFVIARTDAGDEAEVLRRVKAFAEAGADGVLADGLRDLSMLGRMRHAAGRPVGFNQIRGGKSPPCTLSQLADAGASIAIYSTPCLFAAQSAIQQALADLRANDGMLAGSVGVKDCTTVLNANLARRDRQHGAAPVTLPKAARATVGAA